MIKRTVLLSAVAVLVFAGLSTAKIESISADFMNTLFTPTGGSFGLGELKINDSANIVVEYIGGGQVTYGDGKFLLDTSLQQDISSGGIADGLFSGGSLGFYDDMANALLTGDIGNLELKELINGSGVLTGKGNFKVTGGSLAGDFTKSGELVQVTFKVKPPSLSDFSGGFKGLTDLTVVPEPATLALLAAGGVLVAARKRR